MRSIIRQINMDYLYRSAVLRGPVINNVAIYDIVCQWFIYFLERGEGFPLHLQLPDWMKVEYCVPKFHLPSHNARCWALFNLAYLLGAGWTDGEGLERNWSWLNHVARCCSMMGIGSRWDTLDDFANYNNWRKTINLSEYLPHPSSCPFHLNPYQRPNSFGS
jgi:hypothetical protein